MPPSRDCGQLPGTSVPVERLEGPHGEGRLLATPTSILCPPHPPCSHHLGLTHLKSLKLGTTRAMTTMGLGLLTRGSLIPRRKTWGRDEAGEPQVALPPAIFLSNNGFIPASRLLHLLPPAPASPGSSLCSRLPCARHCVGRGRRHGHCPTYLHCRPKQLLILPRPSPLIHLWAPIIPSILTQLPRAEILVASFTSLTPH